jgi:hypothetical protein
MPKLPHSQLAINFQKFEATAGVDPRYQACPCCGLKTAKFLFCQRCLAPLVRVNGTEPRS